MWTLTQVPDADQMDEDIHRLVVIRGVEHKLLAKIKKSPLTHFYFVFLFSVNRLRILCVTVSSFCYLKTKHGVTVNSTRGQTHSTTQLSSVHCAKNQLKTYDQ